MYLTSPVEWYDILYLYAVHTDLKIKRSIVTKTLINDIALSVLPSVSLVKLKNDIIERGLTHPIIVIENTKANYDMAIRQVSEDLILPFDRSIGGNGMIKSFLAYTGNQRIVIAKELGYSYISTLIMPEGHCAHAGQLHIQKGKVDNRDRRSV